MKTPAEILKSIDSDKNQVQNTLLLRGLEKHNHEKSSQGSNQRARSIPQVSALRVDTVATPDVKSNEID